MHASVLIAGPFFVLYILQELHLSYFGYEGGRWPPRSTPHPAGLRPIRGPLRERSLAVHHRLHGAIPADAIPHQFESGLSPDSLFFWRRYLGRLGIETTELCVRFGQAGRPRESHRAIQHGQCSRMDGGSLAWELVGGGLPSRIEWPGVLLQPASNLPFVFFLSGVLRLLVSSSLLGTFHEARQVESVLRQQLLWELPPVKPVAQFVVWTVPKLNR